MEDKASPYRLLLIFSALSTLYIFSMFYRVSNAVIAPYLIRDLDLDAERLGLLGGAFFYSFALVQIPMGPMLDRIGPRFVITTLALAGGVGAFLFAASTSFLAALWGRILIGFGMASILMGTLKVFTLCFPENRFGTLMGAFLSIGTFGNILGASPLAYLSSAIGWRATFAIAGGVTILLALTVFLVMGPATRVTRAETDRSSTPKNITVAKSMGMVLGSFTFWQIAALAFSRYGTFVGLQGLWLGPYLIETKDFSPVKAGNLLSLLAVGVILGSPSGGWFTDRMQNSEKTTGLFAIGLYAFFFLPLLGFFRFDNPFWYGLLFLAMGFFSGFSSVTIYSHAKTSFPIAISGTVTTLVNFFSMAGAAIFMPMLGKVIKSFPRMQYKYPPEAYHLAFLICFLFLIASIAFYALPRKARAL